MTQIYLNENMINKTKINLSTYNDKEIIDKLLIK